MNVVFLDNSDKVGRDSWGIKRNIFTIYEANRDYSVIHVPGRRRDQGSVRNTVSRGERGGSSSSSCPRRVLDACVGVCPNFSRSKCPNIIFYLSFITSSGLIRNFLHILKLKIFLSRRLFQVCKSGCFRRCR